MSRESKMAAKQVVLVTQVRSRSGRTKGVVRTLDALGLRGIGDTRRVVVSPVSIGMIKRVHQLVVVQEAE